MSNSSRSLYEKNLKSGMAKDAAFFSVLDHLERLWNHDRNRYDERIRKLEAEIAKLKSKGQAG